jgi:hypothetical protein
MLSVFMTIVNILSVALQNFIMPIVVVLNFSKPSVTWMSGTWLNNVMLSVIMTIVNILIVVAPRKVFLTFQLFLLCPLHFD